MNELRFLGVLSNAGEEFCAIELPQPFKVQRWPKTKLVQFLAEAENLPDYEIEFYLKDDIAVCDLPNNGCNVVVAALSATNLDIHSEDVNSARSQDSFDSSVFELEERLALIRLYIECNVRLPAYYIYKENLDGLRITIKNISVNRLPLDSSRNELREFNNWVQQFRLAKRFKYLSLAHQYFDRSFDAQDRGHAFLLLMIAAEILFGTGQGEATFRVSRGVATLLSHDNQNGLAIMKDFRGLYAKRSKFVHEGRADGITSEDVGVLRDYLRYSIMKLSALEYEATQLRNCLDAGGMGDFAAIDNWGRR